MKLGDIGSFIRGLTYSTEDIIDDGGIIVIRANNLINGETVNLKNELVRVNKQVSDLQKLKGDDIVICMANGSSALVGKTSHYVESSNEIATIGAFCGVYRSNKKIVRWLMQTKKYRRAISKCLQGGNGAIANITSNDILGLRFVIPQKEKSIVELLQALDQKLNVETSILLKVNNQKQHLLSKMFI